MNIVVAAGLIALGAGVGAPLRYLVDMWCTRQLPNHGLGTCTVNAIGSFAVGVVAGLQVAEPTFALLSTGLCGAFTTFSAMQLHTYRLLRVRKNHEAALFVAFSLASGLSAVTAGHLLGSILG